MGITVPFILNYALKIRVANNNKRNREKCEAKIKHLYTQIRLQYSVPYRLFGLKRFVFDIGISTLHLNVLPKEWNLPWNFWILRKRNEGKTHWIYLRRKRFGIACKMFYMDAPVNHHHHRHQSDWIIYHYIIKCIHSTDWLFSKIFLLNLKYIAASTSIDARI